MEERASKQKKHGWAERGEKPNKNMGSKRWAELPLLVGLLRDDVVSLVVSTPTSSPATATFRLPLSPSLASFSEVIHPLTDPEEIAFLLLV